MIMLRFYQNPYTYPDYGPATPIGEEIPSTPVGMGLKTGTLRVRGDLSKFMECNYLRITDDGKILYAWIEDITFRNEGNWNVSYRVDPWRTYRTKINLGTQYIERSQTVTNKPDPLLGSTDPTPETKTLLHHIGNGSKRVFVVQTRVPEGAAFTRSPVQPTPYQFFFCEYNVNNWLQGGADNPLFNLMFAIQGEAQPENIVTMYSVPWFDTSGLSTQPLTVGGNASTIEGFKFLDSSISPNTILYNEAEINIDENMSQLRRVEHEVQLVIPEAGIISIPDELLLKGNLRLRQDIDLFSGASNYMLVSGTAEYYTQSVRGSSISSIPVVSDPLDTYLSQNQNALATSLIGDVASIAGGVGAAVATGGMGAAVGAGIASGGFNSLMNKAASMKDMKTAYSNPPAFLGTALASNFNGIFWVVVTKQRVGNQTQVNSNFGYPYEMVDALTMPTSGYIKTQGCKVRGDGTVPRWAIEEINQLFDNGIYVHS